VGELFEQEKPFKSERGLVHYESNGMSGKFRSDQLIEEHNFTLSESRRGEQGRDDESKRGEKETGGGGETAEGFGKSRNSAENSGEKWNLLHTGCCLWW